LDLTRFRIGQFPFIFSSPPLLLSSSSLSFLLFLKSFRTSKFQSQQITHQISSFLGPSKTIRQDATDYQKMITTNNDKSNTKTETLVEVTPSSSWNLFPALKDMSLRNSDAFILMFSFNSAASFECLLAEYQQLCQAKSTPNFPLLVLGISPPQDFDCQISVKVVEDFATLLELPFELAIWRMGFQCIIPSQKLSDIAIN